MQLKRPKKSFLLGLTIGVSSMGLVFSLRDGHWWMVAMNAAALMLGALRFSGRRISVSAS